MNKFINSISVVVPTYNEEGSIKSLIKSLDFLFKKYSIEYEIIVVDDHSTDKTQEIVRAHSVDYPLILHKKRGKRGKAYSLFEGFAYAQYENIAMIDSDLQYPPEAIVPMLELLKTHDIVISNRKQKKTTWARSIMSNMFRTIFGKVMFGLSHDVQSGLKVFKREVFERVKFEPKSPWTFDLEFLHRATQAGFKATDYDIEFLERKSGKSQISFLKSSIEVGYQALKLKSKDITPIHFQKTLGSMQGAGVGYKKKQYVTHTTLHHSKSAIQTLIPKQKLFLSTLAVFLLAAVIASPIPSLKIFVAVISFIYFSDVLFNLYIILKSLHQPQEIQVSDKELETLHPKDLPVYSILCPLYKEAHIIPHFLDSISKLDYPKSKLDVMLLLEEDDKESIEAAAQMDLPSYVRTIVVPHSMPKTKPKACNYGLSKAKGEYLVIYDAEDIPDPKQLKKAYYAFNHVSKDVLCLQAKLNYYNPNHNLLTRFFTAEYSLWFDVTLTGLQSIKTSIPLGGTSNHFRTNDLLRLQGWDPFNVTEDADLGVRLFKDGYKTAIIDSTTLEEANTRWGNWLRQRSRWIKGYMQTYLVHTRDFGHFVKHKRLHALYFQLTIGGKIAFILINPLLWLATILYFTLYAYVGPTIESFYPSIVFYMAVVSLIFGNFLFVYYYMIGLSKRDHEGLMKYVLLVPIYWIFISIAGFIALYELILKPHYWQKTTHGFHLLSKNKKKSKHKDTDNHPPVTQTPIVEKKIPVSVPPASRSFGIWNNMSRFQSYIGGSIFIGSIFISNVLNFAFNAYLGRVLTLQDFALVSLISSINSFVVILFNPFGFSMTYRGGYLIGKYGTDTAHAFWKYIANRSYIISGVLTVIWILAVPSLATYFHTDNILPFYLFVPIWIVGLNSFINRGYISAKLQFGLMATVMLFEPIVKISSAYIFVNANHSNIAYISIPLSVVAIFIYTSLVLYTNKIKKTDVSEKIVKSFPTKYLSASFLSGLSTLSFLSLDVVLAKHYLSPDQAGQYALISLVGKMVYFMASLAGQFLIPVVSRREGEGKDSQGIFYGILACTVGLTLLAFIPLGLLGNIFVPFLFGIKALSIVSFLPLFLLAMMGFSVSNVFVSYYQLKKEYAFPISAFLLSIFQIILIHNMHNNVSQVVVAMTLTGIMSVIVMVGMHVGLPIVKRIEMNLGDLFSLFTPFNIPLSSKGQNILIFNWRDNKHKWAGGAESYVHELAKQWVKEGNAVTVFCGNDYRCLPDEVIDGVHIMRRGGFYTMYIWAAIYYVVKLRGKFDLIIDSENGIPFFTPLFAKKPIFLLIHHVHQEVFHEHLMFPFAQLAAWIEGTLMPLVYQDKTVITASESSKKEIKRLSFSLASDIHVVNPGINLSSFTKTKKTSYPSLIYVGRLKPYKNVDVAIKAFRSIVSQYPKARFSIVGEGESRKGLELLVKKLSLTNHVTFLGKVTDHKKATLLASSWFAVQPSMVEGWGITVIEANASGTPVIASRVNGLKDSIVNGRTGLLVEVKNIDAFAKAMRDLILNASLRATLSKSAYKWSQKFSWSQSADNFYTIMSRELEQYSNRKFVTDAAVAINN